MNEVAGKPLELSGSIGKPLLVLLVLMAIPLLIGGIALTFAQGHSSRPPTGSLPAIVLLAPAIVVITAIVGAFLLARANVRVEHGVLVVNTGFGRQRVALASLRKHGLKVVDLHERDELKPARKTMGAGLPGFYGGWFRLRNGESAVCLVLDQHRVCYLRSDEQNLSLLLSLQHPETLRALIDRASAP